MNRVDAAIEAATEEAIHVIRRAVIERILDEEAEAFKARLRPMVERVVDHLEIKGSCYRPEDMTQRIIVTWAGGGHDLQTK